MSSSSDQKLSLWAMSALVVGSMVGAGVFSLPATFGRATGVLGALIAWCIAGGGMLMLAFVFQTLAARKPELDSGVFAYAQAGFGNYMGFLSALAFWAGSCVGNVSYFVLIKSTLGAFFPVFGDGNTLMAVAVASVILWGFHYLILRGIKGATAINTIATIAKIVPIFMFLGFCAWFFQSDTFSANILGYNVAENLKADLLHLDEYGFTGHAAAVYGEIEPESLLSQVRNTMLVTVFVFLGIEGASVYSRLAKNRKDVGVATVLGFIGVLALFMLVTLLSYGVMPRQELAALRQPSMAGVLEHLLGRGGAIFISAGLIISVLGAFLSWTLLAAEVLLAAAKNGSFPKAITRENAVQAPIVALWLTNGIVQAFLIVTMFATYAFTLALELTSALSLFPYLMVAAYGLKLAKTGETYEMDDSSRPKDMKIAFIATVYACLMLYSGGLKYILLSALILGPGSLLFLQARKEQGLPTFIGAERTVFTIIMVAAVVAIISLATGFISI